MIRKKINDIKKASYFTVGVTPIGAPVVPVRPLQPAPVLAVEPRPRRKGLLLRALLRERPGLLRRLLRRQRRKKLRPIDLLPTVPGQEGVVPLREDSFEGSYVAVSGRPGQRTLHVVNGKDSFSGQSVQGAGIAERIITLCFNAFSPKNVFISGSWTWR